MPFKSNRNKFKQLLVFPTLRISVVSYILQVTLRIPAIYCLLDSATSRILLQPG